MPLNSTEPFDAFKVPELKIPPETLSVALSIVRLAPLSITIFLKVAVPLRSTGWLLLTAMCTSGQLFPGKTPPDQLEAVNQSELVLPIQRFLLNKVIVLDCIEVLHGAFTHTCTLYMFPLRKAGVALTWSVLVLVPLKMELS